MTLDDKAPLDAITPLEAITPAEVEAVLRALRRASFTPSSLLLDLEVVAEAVRVAGLDASKDARFVALCTLLADTVSAALDRLRPALRQGRQVRSDRPERPDRLGRPDRPDRLDRPDRQSRPDRHWITPEDRGEPEGAGPEGPGDEAAWLARDFRSGNEVREAWSALHWDYFGPHTDLVATLKRLDIPYHTFRRRRLRGYELLAGSLKAAEIEARGRRAAAAAMSSSSVATAHPAATVATAHPASTAATVHSPATVATAHLPATVATVATIPAPMAPTAATSSPALPALPGPLDLPARRTRRDWVLIATAMAAALAAALAAVLLTVLLAAQAGSRLPFVLPNVRSWFGPSAGVATPTAAATTRITVIGPMVIEPARPRVGDMVTATFRVRNDAAEPRTIARLKAGGRGPHACSRNWSAPNVDFPTEENVHLAPGASYLYQRTRVFAKAGDYFAEPVQLGAAGRWGGIGPSPRAWFDVAERATGAVVTPDCLVVTQAVAVDPPVVTVGRPFTVTARLRNASNDVVRLRMIVVALREADAGEDALSGPQRTRLPGSQPLPIRLGWQPDSSR